MILNEVSCTSTDRTATNNEREERMPNITKNIFLNALVCPILGWMLRSEGDIEGLSDQSLTQAERFRIEQGIEIENRARQLFPNGILVAEKRMHLAQQTTRDLNP